MLPACRMCVALRVVCCALIIVGGAGRAVPASAQVAEHPVSVGVVVSGIGLHDEAGRPITSPGIGAWFTLTMLGPLALDAQLDWFPKREAITYESQGGATLKLTAGTRGTFMQSRRVRVHGIMRTGIIRFSETMTGHEDGSRTIGPKTHLAIDLGGGVEFFPGSRWTPRIDYLTTLYVVPGAVLGRSSPGPATLIATTSAKIADTYQLSAGITYGFGAPRGSSPSEPPSRRWTAGPQGTYASAVNVLDLNVKHRAGIGGFVSYRLSRLVHADAAVNAFPQKTWSRSPWDGGRVLQAVGGLKVGTQSERIGLFVKARGGLNSHGDALKGRESSPYTVSRGHSNLPVLDLGGIVEVGAGPRLLLRFEAGDLVTFYPSRTIVLDGRSVPQGGVPSQQQIQMSIGLGWRF